MHTYTVLQESELVSLQLKIKQRESEAAVLGQQLQTQTAELDELKQSSTVRDEAQVLLEQATADIVRGRPHWLFLVILEL